MKLLLRTLVALAVIALSTRSFAAPPTVEYLFPAGGQRGTTVSVGITGKLDGKTKAWCSCDAAKLSLDTKSRKLQVTIPPDAKPGLHWIRLYNDDSASPPKAFFIGTLPEVAEKEPNDRIEQSQQLPTSMMVINGVLSKTDDVDTFAVRMKKGETLVASMTANSTLGSPMDGILQVVSPRGFVLEQNDDEHGFDPQLTFTAGEEGTYHVRTFAFPAIPNSSVRLSGAGNYIYRLTVTTGPFVDHVFPLAVTQNLKQPVELRGWNIPNDWKALAVPMTDRQSTAGIHRTRLANTGTVQVVTHGSETEREPNSIAQPQPVKLPTTLTGHIGDPRDVDVFRFTVKKNDSLKFRVEARSLESPLDPVLRLFDAKGTVVAQAETRSSKVIDEVLVYRVPADGDYRLEVADLHRRGGWRFVYRLTMTAAPQLESLSVAADQFTLSPGKPLVIPVTLAGSVGSTENLKMEVRGLPPGISMAVSSDGKPGKSGGRGRRSSSSGKTVQITLTAKLPLTFSGPIRIVAVEKAASSLEHAASTPVAGTAERTAHLWLTATKSAAKPGGKKKKK